MIKMVSFFGLNNPIFEDLNERAKDYASAKGIEYVWRPQSPFSQSDVISELKKADVGVIDIEPYGEEIFSQIDQKTALLVRFGVGYDKVDLKSASNHGIAVARTTNANSLGVAEMALSLILAMRRQLPENIQVAKDGDWSQRTVCNETVGATVGIIGFGMIGSTLAKLLKGIGCKVVTNTVCPDMKKLEESGVELVSLDELFRQSDAISIHVPYDATTHHLVNKERLALMKPSAVIVNTARGHIIDEDALYVALKEKQIRGAALDVFAEEPLPTSSPLFSLDNVILMPHVSSQTYESLWRIYKMAIDIAADFFDGKEVPQILNPDYKQNKTA